MKTWRRALQDGLVTGSLASLTSLAGLVLCARCERVQPWGPVNAPSHWVWGDEALVQDGGSLRYSATALAVHHLSAGFWGVLHARMADPDGDDRRLSRQIRDAAITTAAAAWVDLGVVPHRLTPGFQERLSARSMVVVYGLFGLGLLAGSALARRLGQRRARM